MKLDINPIKAKILNETKEDRENIRDIYKQSCKKAVKSACIKWFILLLCLCGFLFLPLIIWYYLNPGVAIIIFAIVYICSVPFIVMLFQGNISFYENSLEKILKQDGEYFPTIQAITDKKDIIVKENKSLSEYLSWLELQIIITVTDEYCSSSSTKTINDERKLIELVEEIESIFQNKRFMSFDKSFSDVEFKFCYGYHGEVLLGEKASKQIYVDDDNVENGAITYRAWYTSWF